MKTYLVLICLILTFTASQANSTIIDDIFSTEIFDFPHELTDQSSFSAGGGGLTANYVHTLFGSVDINDFVPFRSSLSAISREGAQKSAVLAYDWEASFISVPTDQPDLFPEPSLSFGFSFNSDDGEGGILTPGDFISGHGITKIFAGSTINFFSGVGAANSPYDVEFRLFNVREISEPNAALLVVIGLLGFILITVRNEPDAHAS